MMFKLVGSSARISLVMKGLCRSQYYFCSSFHIRKANQRHSILSFLDSPALGQMRSYTITLNPQQAGEDVVLNTVKTGLKQKQGAAKKPNDKPSLRKAALQAETTRVTNSEMDHVTDSEAQKKLVTAYCGAQQYNLKQVEQLLLDRGVRIDPTGTSLYPQVIHIEMPVNEGHLVLQQTAENKAETGDVFIFPSGTVVAWNVPNDSVQYLISKILYLTAHNQHNLEDENFEYVEDRHKERSAIKRGVIVLGTKAYGHDSDRALTTGNGTYQTPSEVQHRHAKTVLAKIAFSSGLARSTKIAVLENLLDKYLEDTKHIPGMLMSGNLAALPRSFIYQKMGQLLNIRGQLNLSSDITDSLPDMLWDTEAELGLESYYDQISRALDTTPRIESLNQKMDYAHEIASILREELSVIRDQNQEKNSTRLEWIIIALIAVEVGFGCWHLYKEHKSGGITEVRVVGRKEII